MRFQTYLDADTGLRDAELRQCRLRGQMGLLNQLDDLQLLRGGVSPVRRAPRRTSLTRLRRAAPHRRRSRRQARDPDTLVGGRLHLARRRRRHGDRLIGSSGFHAASRRRPVDLQSGRRQRTACLRALRRHAWSCELSLRSQFHRYLRIKSNTSRSRKSQFLPPPSTDFLPIKAHFYDVNRSAVPSSGAKMKGA